MNTNINLYVFDWLETWGIFVNNMTICIWLIIKLLYAENLWKDEGILVLAYKFLGISLFYMENHQSGKPFSNICNNAWKDHPNMKWSNKFALNPT